jgi:site-specific DNA-methyltransferase (cytosine-N4-specific)
VSTHLLSGDSLKLLYSIKYESIVIICNSPPYGDNSTTVTYGQFSSLALRWIPREDLDGYAASVDYNYTSIDKLSLGGSKRKPSNNLVYLNEYLELISKSNQQKIINFTENYIDVCKKLSSKIKNGGYIIFTVGNKKVDNQLFPFVKINDELATMYGFSKVTELKRSILRKRIAKKVSSVDSKAVESMSEEYILIYKKEGENQNAYFFF